MKLPLLFVLLLLPPRKNPPRPRRVPEYVVVSLLDLPPKQKKTVEMSRHAQAAHSNPNAYFPNVAVWPFNLKLLRPLTYAAL